MKITKKAAYYIAFTVEAFWPEEGGMGHETFGEIVDTIEEAVHLLEIARITGMADLKANWVIVGHVRIGIT